MYNTPPLTEGFWQRACPGGFGINPRLATTTARARYVTDNRKQGRRPGPTILDFAGD